MFRARSGAQGKAGAQLETSALGPSGRHGRTRAESGGVRECRCGRVADMTGRPTGELGEPVGPSARRCLGLLPQSV